MGNKKRVTFEYDPSEFFDVLAKVGDGGSSLGTRMVATFLGDDSFATDVGLAFYGIERVPTPTDKELDDGQ